MVTEGHLQMVTEGQKVLPGNTTKYLSQMTQNFQVNFLGVSQNDQHIKDDPILKVSTQEPSTSSKYDLEDRGS